jgi:hypothetical protein
LLLGGLRDLLFSADLKRMAMQPVNGLFSD